MEVSSLYILSQLFFDQDKPEQLILLFVDTQCDVFFALDLAFGITQTTFVTGPYAIAAESVLRGIVQIS